MVLYGQVLKNRPNVDIYSEFFALDLLKNSNNAVNGAVFYSMQDGTVHRFRSRATVLCTGGAGRLYSSTTAGFPCTGDGAGLVIRAGLPVMDAEFVQFHPTGLHGAGVLVSEAARGEGGILLNCKGERFMIASKIHSF